MAAISEVLDLKTSNTEEIAKKIAMYPKSAKTKARIVVATQGKDPTLIIKYEFDVFFTIN